MAYEYLTIRALAGELGARLRGRRIGAVRRLGAVLELDVEDLCLVVLTGSRGALYLRDREPGAEDQGNRDPDLAYLVDARIVGVDADPVDRVLGVRLERTNVQGRSTYGWLRVELVRPHVTAVLGRERNGEVIAVWGGRGRAQPRLRPGAAYRELGGPPRLLPGRDGAEAFVAALSGAGDRTVAQAAAGVVAMADRRCMAAILAGMGQAPDVRVDALGVAGIRSLWERCTALYRRPPSAPCAVWCDGERWEFSVLPPVPPPVQITTHASVSAATAHWLDAETTQERQRRQVQSARAGLEALERVLSRRQEALAADLAEAAAAEELERKGSALLACLSRVTAGVARVVLEDVFDPAGEALLEIELDPGRTPAGNAAAYLKRASKLYRRRQLVPARLEGCRARLEAVRQLGRGLGAGGADQGGHLELVEAWLAQQQTDGPPRRTLPPDPRASAHPRRYRTSTGWSVWAGRNNRENDVLTHRLATPNDYWFHAHGYAGAHVILRREGRAEEPSARTLEEAAAVAAYWSKGKTARRVPVVYALARHVSRARGAPAGQAVVRREKTLMVAPQLLTPEDSVA